MIGLWSKTHCIRLQEKVIMDYSQIMTATVGLTVKDLNDGEVAALYLAMQMGGIMPHHHGYEKLEALRTNPDGSMHQATLEALELCLQVRTSQFK
jgi:hypothetical protein